MRQFSFLFIFEFSFVFVFVCTFALSALAVNDSNTHSTHTDASVCEHCSSDNQVSNFKDIVNFENIIKGKLSCTESMKSSEKVEDIQKCAVIQWEKATFEKYPHCGRFFIDKDGKIGDLGALISQMIADDIEQNKEKSVFLMNNPDFDEHCPGFRNMTPIAKVAFYTWIYELTAFAETSCNPNLQNHSSDVPNGPAVGLYQLELATSLRDWRGPHCKAASAEQMMTAKANTECAFDILKYQLIHKGRPFGALNADENARIVTSYWASHNPLTKKKMKNAEMDFNNCVKKNPKTFHKVCSETPAVKFFRRLPRFPLCNMALFSQPKQTN